MTTTETTAAHRQFAIIGATGKQGRATARALLDAGAEVRALVRDPGSSSSEVLSGWGAELVPADLDDPAGLRAALTGVDGVFAMTVFSGERGTEGEVEHGVALADAAVAADVPHVVYSSVGGAERSTGVPHFESKRRVEEHLEGLALRTSLIRPTFFMENLTGPMAPRQEDGTIVVRLPIPAGVPLQMVAVADIGAVAAAVLLDPDRMPDDQVEIAGDELTGERIAEAFGTDAGLPGRYEPLPLEALRGNTDLEAMFAWLGLPPSYRADFAATAALSPAVQDLPTWLAAAR